VTDRLARRKATGEEVRLHASEAGYHAGDLLFFGEERRVSRVALWVERR